MMQQAASKQELLAECMRLPADRQALITRLGEMGVADDVFVVALALAPMLQFDSDTRVRREIIAERAGLSHTCVRLAMMELVKVGAIERRCYRRSLPRIDRYRLAKSFASGAGARHGAN